MDDQVGIAPDRRGEVGVAVQVQTEVADVLRGVEGLHLGAQDDFVDDLGVRGVAGFFQQLVEALGVRRLALVPGLADGVQEVGQVEDLLLAGRVVNAIDQRRVRLLQRLGGADVGLDHHLFDQAVGLQRLARLDAGDAAVGRHDDAALGAFDGQRAAALAALQHGAIGVPQRIEDGLHDRPGGVVQQAVDGGLRLFIGQLGVAAHQAARELVSGLPAVLVEDHAHGHAGAVLALLQAAQAVGQHFRQHRLDPVGEVGRVALGPRLAVQRRVRAHIGGDVSDGDPDDPAARIGRVFVALGIDGVVMVARVSRVDGDEGDVAQVFAPLQRRDVLFFGLALHGLGEAGRHAVGVDGDDGGRARVVLAPDLAALGPVAMLALLDGGQHQVAVAQVRRLGGGHQQHILGAFVDRLNPRLAPALADDAQHAVGSDVQPLDQARLPAVDAPAELDQQAVAHAGRRAATLAIGHQDRARRILAALDQLDVELAVGVAIHDIDHPDRGQGAGFGKALAAALAQAALGLQLLQHVAQVPTLGAFQAEGAGDVGLFGFSGLAQEGHQGFFVGQARSGAFRCLDHCALSNALRGERVKTCMS